MTTIDPLGLRPANDRTGKVRIARDRLRARARAPVAAGGIMLAGDSTIAVFDNAPSDLPSSAVEVVALEGKATSQSAGQYGDNQEVWLFQPDREPEKAATADLAALVADDANSGQYSTPGGAGLRDPSESFLEDLLRLKRYVFALSQLADQHRDVFVALLRPDFPWVAGTPVEEYFRDLETRLARLVDLLASALDAVNGAFDIYVSHMAHRTNQVIKLLAMVSTILLPSTLVLGLFGTNFATSIRSVPSGTPLGFAAMVATMALVSVGVLAAFRRRRWL